MALIKCPNCGNDLSDKASKCVKCGYEMPPQIKEDKVCPECKSPINDDDNVCSNCGFPLLKEKDSTSIVQDVALTGIKVKKPSKKLLGIIIGVLAAVSIIFLGIITFKEQAQKQNTEEYLQTMKDLNYEILSSAVQVEEAGNLVIDVWNNAIKKKENSTTNKYTKTEYGYFVSDFNEALQNLYRDPEFAAIITAIKSDLNDIQTQMKSLVNPPEEYQEAYTEFKSYYELYVQFANMVISPSGSLQTFSTNFNNTVASFVNKYDSLSIYLN